jgi:hypothetical protein
MPKSILILLAAAAVVLSAGCGGSGGGSSSHRLSAAAFRSQGNQICTDLNRQEKPDIGSTSKAAIDRNLDRIDSALGKLKDLEPPTRDESHFRAMLKHFEQSVAFIRSHEVGMIHLTQQLQKHPSDATTRAQYQSLVRPLVQEVQLAARNATALGLTVCSTGLTGGSSSSG